MVQTLLAERFRLKVRYETREISVYALRPAKDGSRIHESAAETAPRVGFVIGKLTFQSTPISFLVTLLTELTRRKVLDETGLKGNYDFTLERSPDRPAPKPASDSTA
jgi:uncharacterized protein (TIGR03435 family)